MQDRFKFRVWNTRENKMIDFKSMYNASEFLNVGVQGVFLADDPNHVYMQCTGLLADKSYRGPSEEDRLIFEGDVVRGKDDHEYEILWNNFKAQFQGKVIKESNGAYEIGARFMISQDSADGLEIIDTMHDGTEGDE